MQAWPAKDPDDVLDYSLDWSDVLAADANDTIESVAWTIEPAGELTKDSQAEAGAISTIWLSGGEAGTRYEIGCLLTTTGGRTYDRTIELPVRQA